MAYGIKLSEACRRCDVTGQIYVIPQSDSTPLVFGHYEQCPDCKGTGRKPNTPTAPDPPEANGG